MIFRSHEGLFYTENIPSPLSIKNTRVKRLKCGAQTIKKKLFLFQVSFFVSSHFSLFCFFSFLSFFFFHISLHGTCNFYSLFQKETQQKFCRGKKVIFSAESAHILNRDALLRKCWEAYLFEETKWQPFL